MEYLIIAIVLYVAIHAFHSGRKWQHYRKRAWYKRIWVSVPGPFGTRISKRV